MFAILEAQTLVANSISRICVLIRFGGKAANKMQKVHFLAQLKNLASVVD